MDFRQLEIFKAVMDCGSATAAAQLLQLSQPAVSRQLSGMEAELGLDLFVRSGGRLRPTADAEALYDEAAYAFESLERVLNLARRMRGRDSGVLRVAAPFAFGEALLPRILERLARQRTQLRFVVEFARYDTIAASLARRQADIGILKLPLTHPGLRQLPMAECDSVCVLPRAHRLSGAAEVSVDDLSREPLVLLGRDTAWRSELQVLLRKAQRLPQVRIDTDSAAAACGFAAQGLGLAVLPALLASQFMHQPVVFKPVAAPLRHRFVVACASALRTSPLVERFAECACEAARDAMAMLIPDTAARARRGRTRRQPLLDPPSPSGQSRM